VKLCQTLDENYCVGEFRLKLLSRARALSLTITRSKKEELRSISELTLTSIFAAREIASRLAHGIRRAEGWDASIGG
jgi:hypothetical protein